MGLDASIPLQIKTYDPVDSMSKGVALRHLMQQGQMQDIQLADAQRKQQEDATLSDLYRSAMDPTTGKVDSTKMLQGMAGAGLGSRIPAYQKQMTDAELAQANLGKVKSETDAKTFETLKGRLGMLQNTVSSLAMKPDLSHQDVIQAAAGLVQSGAVPEDQALTFIRGLPGDPAKLKNALITVGLQTMDSSKRLEAMMPKFQMVNLGGTDQAVDMNPLTNPNLAGSSFRKTATPGEILTDRRVRDNNASGNIGVIHGYKGLTEEENSALFGPNGAVTQGRLDPNKINSKTAGLFAKAELSNPGTNYGKISSDISLNRNATFRQKAMTAESIPEVLNNMVEAGKKVGFSDNRTIGKLQALYKGEMNDPDYTEYMALRNDGLMSIAGVMRGNGMTDMAHKVEMEAAQPTMSPQALDAWLRGQMKSLQPRLDNNRSITGVGNPRGGNPAPAAPSNGSRPPLTAIFGN